MDLEQEFLPALHAAADLGGDDGSIADDAADDKLVGHVLCDHFTGVFGDIRSRWLTANADSSRNSPRQ